MSGCISCDTVGIYVVTDDGPLCVKCAENKIELLETQLTASHTVLDWHDCPRSGGKIRTYPAGCCSMCMGQGKDFDPRETIERLRKTASKPNPPTPKHLEFEGRDMSDSNLDFHGPEVCMEELKIACREIDYIKRFLVEKHGK